MTDPRGGPPTALVETMGPLTRTMLAAYGDASGDDNPLHTDADFARDRGGFGDVIGQGMLAMALAGRVLSGLARPEAIRAFSVRFVGPTRVGDVLTARGELRSAEGGGFAILLTVETADGRMILTGEGLVIAVADRAEM